MYVCMYVGVIKVDKATGKPIPGSKAALVYGQMNEPPGARLVNQWVRVARPLYVCMYVVTMVCYPRARVALTGLAIAEYFRDQEGQGGWMLHIHTYIHFSEVFFFFLTRTECMYVCMYVDRCVAFRGQYFPLHAGRFGSVCPVRSHPFRCGVSVYVCMYVC